MQCNISKQQQVQHIRPGAKFFRDIKPDIVSVLLLSAVQGLLDLDSCLGEWMEGQERMGLDCGVVKREKHLTTEKEGVDKHGKCGGKAVNNKLTG